MMQFMKTMSLQVVESMESSSLKSQRLNIIWEGLLENANHQWNIHLMSILCLI